MCTSKTGAWQVIAIHYNKPNKFHLVCILALINSNL